MKTLIILMTVVIVGGSFLLNGDNDSSNQSRDEEPSSDEQLYEPDNVQNGNIKPELKSQAEAQAYGLMQALLVANIAKQNEHPQQRRHQQIQQAPPLSQQSSGDDVWDPKLFAKKAVQFHVQKEFLKYYRKYSWRLTNAEIQSAQQTYNRFKLDSFESKGKAGVVLDLGTNELKAVVDVWQNSNSVSPKDAQQMKNIIDGRNLQLDGDYILKRKDGTLVFTRFAFKDTSSGGKQTGSMVYMFRSYKFRVAMDATTLGTSDCFVWRQICTNNVRVTSQLLSRQEAKNMGNYMQIQAGRDYDENIGSYMTYLVTEANRYERFQPTDFKQDWNMIKQQPDADPSTILPNKNALDLNNYEV